MLAGLVAASACGTKAPTITGVTATVNLDGVLADQLELSVSTSQGTALTPTRRPAQAGGNLASPQSVSIYLPDALAGLTATCTATAVYRGQTIGTTVSATVPLVLHELVPVSLTIPVNRHGDAGAADTMPAADAAIDADAASPSDVAPDAGAFDTLGAKAAGQTCASGAECDSTLCIDGVCCGSACDDNCSACNLAGKQGVCAPKPAGTAAKLCADQGASSCGYDGTCDGNGGCRRYAAGVSCKTASCQTSKYVPASACDGQGACVAASPVDCTPYICDATGATPACLSTCQAAGNDCVSPAVCANGSCGARLKAMNGAGCVAAADCMSGFCADGVCCTSACTGACMACNVDTSGTCQPVAAAKADPHKVCKDAGATTCGRNGLCDGAGACALYPATTTCAAGSCKGATLHNARKCDGKGVCQAAAADTDCTPYRCDPTTTACYTTCTLLQCAARHTCVMTACQ